MNYHCERDDKVQKNLGKQVYYYFSCVEWGNDRELREESTVVGWYRMAPRREGQLNIMYQRLWQIVLVLWYSHQIQRNSLRLLYIPTLADVYDGSCRFEIPTNATQEEQRLGIMSFAVESTKERFCLPFKCDDDVTFSS